MSETNEDDETTEKLERILKRFGISIATANDLVELGDYEMVIIADDSTSMLAPAAPANQRVLGKRSASRWDELKETIGLMVDIGACFDDSGLDIYFLNRGKLANIKSTQDPGFVRAFASGPNGGTPLTQTLQIVARSLPAERPVLLFILTDGVPHGGPQPFCNELRRLLTKQSTQATVKVQIMACTGDDDAVGWLNDLDRQYAAVDVTDDYFSELVEVSKAKRKQGQFTRADWAMKAMLGPISHKFDAWDEIHIEEYFQNCPSCGGCIVS